MGIWYRLQLFEVSLHLGAKSETIVFFVTMSEQAEYLKRIDKILEQIMQTWFERTKSNYVTEEESRQLGVEPEIKIFSYVGARR